MLATRETRLYTQPENMYIHFKKFKYFCFYYTIYYLTNYYSIGVLIRLTLTLTYQWRVMSDVHFEKSVIFDRGNLYISELTILTENSTKTKIFF